jgi:hypothetical protein
MAGDGRAQLSAGSLARGRKRRLQLMTWALAVSPQETISGLISPFFVNFLATSYFRLSRVS